MAEFVTKNIPLAQELLTEKTLEFNKVPRRNWAKQKFGRLAIGGKAALLLTLALFAFINGNNAYVSKNPRKFLTDALITGLFAGIAGGLLCLTRGRSDLLLSHFLIGTLLFFIYHVFREFAGYFSIPGLGSEKMESVESKEYKFIKIPVIIIMICLFIYAVVLACMAHVGTGGNIVVFILELFTFASIMAAGEAIVAKDHGDNPKNAFLTSLAMFSVIHLILQGGGFYEHLYK